MRGEGWEGEGLEVLKSMRPLPLLSQERLAQIEREKEEELERMRVEAAAKREEIQRMEEEAENRRNMPVDDSKIVEQIFGFLPEGEQPAGDSDHGGRGTHTCTCNVHTHSFTPPPTHPHTHSLPSTHTRPRSISPCS